MTWGSTSDAWIMSIRQSTDVINIIKKKAYNNLFFFKNKYVKITNQMAIETEENLKAAAGLNRIGFAIERLPYGMLIYYRTTYFSLINLDRKNAEHRFSNKL